jgi:asparagine synthase (glutamine-hydrolysing)
MCGVAGILDSSRVTSDALQRRVRDMTSTLAHRGPDDQGIWLDPDAGLALGHRRLAVIDLTREGRQPMLSRDGRVAITFNGEIYNYRELRTRLERSGLGFRGASDTEVLVEAMASWGVSETLRLLNGMFAFALWDREARRLTLVRDRMGEKPLYYGRIDGAFVFASELRALRAHPGFSGSVDRSALAAYLRHDCVPAPQSIYDGIWKLRPGHILHVDAATTDVPESAPYWSLAEIATAGLADPLDGSTDDVVGDVEAALTRSVGLRMVADVPVGTFLSGGVDSSLVAALVRLQSPAPPRTFTIGFDDAAYDEAPHAAGVARYLGTDHTELRVTIDDVVRAVGRLPAVYDEPFADSSQIPTFLVAEMTRRHVTVSLSGDGGDELFAGYARYRLFDERLWKAGRILPSRVRAGAGSALTAVPPAAWERAIGWAGPLLPKAARLSRPGEKLYKMARALSHDSVRTAYPSLMRTWDDPSGVLHSDEPTGSTASPPWLEAGATVDQLMYADQVGYLPDDILAKVDRATMAVSLEARVPLLDHNLVELAWRVPLKHKLRGGSGKWVLRQILARHVPVELFDRPKMGFGVPIGTWLRGPLRDWAESLLDHRRLTDGGYFRPAVVRRLWLEHLGRTGEWPGGNRLWSVLMFEAWLEESRLPAPA